MLLLILGLLAVWYPKLQPPYIPMFSAWGKVVLSIVGLFLVGVTTGIASLVLGKLSDAEFQKWERFRDS